MKEHPTSKTVQEASNISFLLLTTHTTYAANLVQSVVSNTDNGAGATLKFKDTSGIEGIATNVEVQKVEYYSLDGILLSAPTKGLAIQVTTLKDGTKKTKKIIR